MTSLQTIRPDTEYDETLIRGLDPLGADSIYPLVPAMNRSADTRALAAALDRILPDTDRLAMMSFHDCLATMRDIGLFLGSLRRHGTQPVEAVPRVKPVLFTLAQRTDMVPRDTVHHYTEWNPTDGRQRMHTGEAQEEYLMNSTRMSLPHLRVAVRVCERLADADPRDPDVPDLLATLADKLGAFNAAIAMVIERVTPEFFAQQMRPYFQEINVGSSTYFGPAAAHVPLFLVDIVLWASDRCSEGYAEFIKDVSQYTLPSWRALIPRWQGRSSLVSRLVDALQRLGDSSPDPALHESAKQLRDVLHTLLVFRGKHLGIARKAYQDEIKLYDLGSGGGSLSLLQDIVFLTREHARLAGTQGA